MFNKLGDTDVEAFDRFFKGTMEEEELNAFKLRLANDASFRDSYLLYKMIVDKVRADAEASAALRQRLFEVSKKSKRLTWLKWLTGTAAMLIISFFVIKSTRHEQPDYSKYLFEEPGLRVQMSGNDESNWASFNGAFAIKDFSGCLVFLEKFSDNDTAKYYTGICHEFLKKQDKAVANYEQLYNSTNTLLRDKAKYRSAVLLLNGNKKDRAIKLLNEIAGDPGNSYKPDAIKVLEAINGKK